MRYQLYRSVPVIWRGEHCVQLGVDDPVLIDGLTAGDVDLIHALRAGISDEDFRTRAAQLGVAPPRAASLLRLLEEAQALIPTGHGAQERMSTSHVDALGAALGASPSFLAERLARRCILLLGPLRRQLGAVLTDAGLRAVDIERAEEALTRPRPLVILTAVWAVDAMSAGFLADQGIEHMHLLIGQAEARISHIIVPGVTPCTACAIGFHCDEDTDWLDSWQALRQQAAAPARSDPLLCTLALTQTAVHLRAHLIDPQNAGDDLRVTLTDGIIETTSSEFHERCTCRLPTPANLSA